MIAIIISFILIVIAAAFNAVMDTIRYHWVRSIFAAIKIKWLRKWFESYWLYHMNQQDSTKGVIDIPGTKIDVPAPFWDGWHFAKAVMLLCIASSLSLLIYQAKNIPQLSLLYVVGIFIGYTLIWHIVFELLFNKLFIVSKK